MHLKKIVTSGFKSFADRITITLDQGITGIVGPNGAGKSNIIDAVRWVMGEQNAKSLRGEKATDIIFAGSERRKALGMAEVSLVFDNSDASPLCPVEYRHEPEVTLTRRMYVDGQREYLINKRPCRLKDIVGFFATTGLGGRNYSMIQQGQIDHILSAKPEDIREMVESAAGTIVFKKRRHEAQRKLEQTHLNLSRIEDILVEVEKALDSLQSQVEKAKVWRECTNRLREEEMSLFAHNHHRFKTKQTALTEKVDEAIAKQSAADRDSAELEKRQAELQDQLEDSDPEVQQLQERISASREQIARSEASLKSSKDRIFNGELRLQELATELEEDDANLKVLEAQVEGAQSELSAAESNKAKMESEAAVLKKEADDAIAATEEYHSRLSEGEDQIRDLERLLESNRIRCEGLEKDRDRAKSERASEEETLQSLRLELGEAQLDLQVAEKAAGEKKHGLDRELREKHDREAAVAERYEQLRQASLTRDQLKDSYHSTKARVTSLEELIAGATAVASSWSALKELDEASSVCQGLLTDHVSFRETADELPRRTRAMLEQWTERLLVPDLESLHELARICQAAGPEVGTFPVSVASPSGEESAQSTSAIRAWAEKYEAEPITAYLRVDHSVPGLDGLLARLYFLPSLQLDAGALRAIPENVLAFTAQGLAGSDGHEYVIGGTSPGILSRKIEMESLCADLKDVERKLAAAQAEIDQWETEIDRNRQIVAEIDQRLQSQNEDVLEVMSVLQSAQQVVDRKTELIQSAEDNIAGYIASDEKFKQELGSLAETRDSLAAESEEVRKELEQFRDESEQLLNRRQNAQKLYDARRIEMAKAEARAATLKDSFLATQAQLQLLQNKLSRRYEERTRLEQDIERAREEVVQAHKDVETFVREREKFEEEYKLRREEHSGLIEELRKIDAEMKQFRDIHDEAQQSLTKSNVELERVRVSMSGLVEQALEKYKIDLETHEFTLDNDFNHETAQRTVTRLRNKIDGMGAINMMALNEHEEKSERRDFILAQREEVLSSIDLLDAAIAEIEETSLRKFMEIFERINLEFADLFPILFPGGEGRLELTDEANPLEGGIEILCRLPGKSMKAMSLFSGGEKALTAIALIFSMLRTKPTPFCFLDEVDAPLDESNVVRYNRVLMALAEQFQFIVITHNRRTMEVLDVLYGITMQEPGVSKVVGVDMQKDLPPHLRKALDKPVKLPTRAGAVAHSEASPPH